MNAGIGEAIVGQWYAQSDTGETFQVTGFDEGSGTIEIQTDDGNLNEIEQETWRLLPLALAEPPADWSNPAEDAHIEDWGAISAE